jgi:riboflavin synthase
MFTGLVEEVGSLRERVARGPSARVRVACGLGAHEPLVLGESIAVNGACLTVATVTSSGFEADVSSETLAKTNLGALALPAAVHLERASKLGARMGGHVVLGHVDAVASVVEIVPSGEARSVTFSAPAELAPYLAPKGSVALDGASLTLNHVEDAPSAVRFSVMLIPHTLAGTTFESLRAGARVNVEVDVLARYVERQLGWSQRAAKSPVAPESRDVRLLEALRKGGYT